MKFRISSMLITWILLFAGCLQVIGNNSKETKHQQIKMDKLNSILEEEGSFMFFEESGSPEKRRFYRDWSDQTEKARLELIEDNHFDVEVLLPGDGSPACRLLLPEFIYAKELKTINKVHTYSASWKKSGDELQGIISLDQGVGCSLWLKPSKEGVLIKISIKNNSPKTLRNVQVNICAGVNHLPNVRGADWCNRDFMPDSVPLDRTAQGMYWYQVVTPERLKAWLPAKNWILMHPHTENPLPDSKDLYRHKVSQTNKSLGCAVMSANGEELFYQIWDTGHSRYQTPFAGNACMHLIPQVSKKLLPGETVTIEGMAGIFRGGWEELAVEFDKFIHADKK